MNKTTTTTLLTAVLATALGVTAAVSSAAPADGGAIEFSARSTGVSATISTGSGALVIEDGVLEIEAADGTVLAGTPLRFRVDDFEFPIEATVSRNTATLTPVYDIAHAVYQPAALPFEDQAPWRTEYERERAAWDRMTATISMGATLGTLIGGIGGAAVGCILGGIAGATVAAATIVGLFGPFIPAAAIGCLGGILAVGALGTLAGQIFITAPIAIGAVIQYFTTINAPFTPR
ncbi:hypothetical protein F3087_40480 [Nocardia colli]|uniref:DUF8020 domain-containing protein n=1 Tax=Nocardia colli TaxID=2545717 RepID=A0A5N0DU42_9NOCA|nr:hypothetical protein [Nocardia colli]KAA8880598.1 hypothetical protein F3087_40480 [Nocardia colli]